ncbi:MAG: biopolymer transporter ExbD [Treponema sp.]|nr:biopolymer transporter ExbD [Treponema sp.]
MKLKRAHRLGFAESSAASDVAFLLIIYFIVIAGFNINKGFLINLPAKDSTRLILRDDLMRFEIDGDGYVIYESELVGIPEAANLIRSAQAANPNIAVILSINPAAKWQRIVSFVELAQDLQIDSFSFSMMKDVPQ